LSEKLAILKFDVLGSVHIGNYAIASNSYLITLDELGERKLNEMGKILNVKVIGIRLINCRIIRPFFAGNSNGLIISKIVDEETIRRIKKGLDLKIEVLNSKYTAVGNLITANDKGCIISPVLSKKEAKKIEEVLDVEVVQAPISQATYVGSLLRANNRGGIITPYAEDEEIEKVKSVLKVGIHRGTINSGMHFISAGIIVNDYGILVGGLTDGTELMNISEAFGIR